MLCFLQKQNKNTSSLMYSSWPRAGIFYFIDKKNPQNKNLSGLDVLYLASMVGIFYFILTNLVK